MTTDESTRVPSIVMSCPLCHSEFPEGTNFCLHDGSQLSKALPDPLIGSTFADRYEILEKLGTGGMSVVYKARQKFMSNLVAIKVLHPQLGADPNNFERFLMEAKAAATSKHPNVIQVFDFGTSDGKAFLIMEYLKGSTLEDVLERGRLDLPRALNLFMQACDGLQNAHEHGVIHRDLKPGNMVIIKEEGKAELVKIVDFGIAKIIPQDGTNPQNLTATGEVFGSPLYMSPEQCQGKELDARSDIYSLGCVIYEALTGMPPLMGSNSFETMNKHVSQLPRSLREAAPELSLPELIDACVLKALSKDPSRRQQSMSELKKQLMLVKGTVGDIAGDTGEERGQKKSTSEMQQLVLDAMALSQKQTAKNKQLRVMLVGVYAVLLIMLVIAALYLNSPGPKQDPGTPWQKLCWRQDIEDGNRLLSQKKFMQAAAKFQSAAVIGKEIGDIDDKRVKALMWAVGAYEDGKQEERADAVRKEAIEANLEHMDKIANSARQDFGEITDLDGALVSAQQLNPELLDSHTLDAYSASLIARARASMNEKQFRKAESWLREAVELEEKTPGHGKGELTRCANEMIQSLKSPEDKKHLTEIEALLQRAKLAERE